MPTKPMSRGLAEEAVAAVNEAIKALPGSLVSGRGVKAS